MFIPVTSLETFVRENQYKFCEEMRYFTGIDVFQNGISGGYVPGKNRGNFTSTARITLYRDGLVAFDSLIDMFMGGENAQIASLPQMSEMQRIMERGVHAGWLAYEIQRLLQLGRACFQRSGFSSLNFVLRLEHIEDRKLIVPISGMAFNASGYSGSHHPISRKIKLSEINEHDSEKRNVVTSAVTDIIAEVYRIFGLSEVSGAWDGDGKLTYVKGVDSQR